MANETEKIGLHNLSPAPGSHRNRKRLGRGPGLRHGQDVRQGTQGHQGARGPSRPGRRQAAVRGRPDAAHAPAAEARLHEPVPRGDRRSCASTTSAHARGRRSHARVARRGGADPRAKGSGEAAGERRALAARSPCAASRSAPARARRSSRPEAASRSKRMAQANPAAASGEHLQDAGAVGQDHLHAPLPADLPDRRAHHGAGRRRRRADGLLRRTRGQRRTARPVRPVRRRRSCRARRCSRSASCRTSRPASSCRSPAR